MGAGKVLGKIAKGAVKGTADFVSDISSDVIDGLGAVTRKTMSGGFELGKKASPLFIRDANLKELEEAGFAGKLIKKRLTVPGLLALGAGTMAVSTGKEIKNTGMTKFNKLGDVSVGENLDRLISYDGSGFVDGINNISQGDPEVMQDVVKNTFSSVNQYGASGDLVFALHNRRQG